MSASKCSSADNCDGDRIANSRDVDPLNPKSDTDADGRPDNTDDCTPNGFVDGAFEECDDGNTSDGDGCTNDCRAARCGDGFVYIGQESCDDGNVADGDYCQSDCAAVIGECGDGTLQSNELCDDGNGETEPCVYGQESCLVCDENCEVVPGITSYCGDSTINGSEACDDGNNSEDGNGCTGNCSCSSGFVGAGCAYSDATTCSGHGSVSVSGECTCDGGWEGSDCSQEVTVPAGMVEVPAGAFMMGCNTVVDNECGSGESPYHEITLDSFFIDIHEVTAGEYKACVDAGACSYNGATSTYHTYNNSLDTHPINYVNWAEATTYCTWKGKRLPTEAEWEKASRGTDGRKYPWGNETASCSYAVMSGCGGDTQPVGSIPAGASPYGAMDMSGNVWEWVNDWYASDYYSTSPSANPPGPESGSSRVLRGGSINISADYLRSSSRFGNHSSYRSYSRGFRCAQ